MEIDDNDVGIILAALNTAFYKSVSEDMVESYRQMDNRGKSSPYTKQLEKAVQLLEGYVSDEIIEEEEVDVVSE